MMMMTKMMMVAHHAPVRNSSDHRTDVWQEINVLHSARLLYCSVLTTSLRLVFVSSRWSLVLLIHRNLDLPLSLLPSRWLLVLLIHRNLDFPLSLLPSRWLLVLLIHRILGLPLGLSLSSHIQPSVTFVFSTISIYSSRS